MRGIEKLAAIGQCPQLAGGRIDEFLAAVADGRAPEAGHPVEKTFPLAVPEIYATPSDHHPRVLGLDFPIIIERRYVARRVNGLVLRGASRLAELGVHIGSR